MLKLHCALIVPACFLVACAGATPAPKAPPATTDSAGVVIVNNASPQWDLSARWRVDTVPITRVGHDENEIESQFKSIWGATRLSNGNIVVSADNDVRMFGPDGKFIKTVARRGNGPGEFPSGGRLLRLPGDSILVWHEVAEGGRKIAIFGSDGSFIREERPDGDALRKLGPWSECHSMVFRDRSWLGCKKDSTIPATATNRASKLLAKGYSSPGPGHLRQFERRHLIPATLDTTHRIGIEGGIEQFGVALKGGGETFIQHPYYSRSLIASGGAPLRIATITNPAYNIEMWTPDGRLERIIRRANGRRIPSAEEKAELPALLRQWNDRRDADEATLAQMPTPDSLPAATGLLVGADGHIVVGREGTLPPYRRATFDIFNPDGYWLGELELPGRTYIMELGTDYILALHRNEDDVPVLGVFPLHRGSTKNSASAQATTR